jgi:redox-sensitive bicupin YhaK (pirin superfamily)
MSLEEHTMTSPATPATPATSVQLIAAERAVEGDGFVVRRPFPTARHSYIDPFLLFDHMGPAEFAPGEGTGTPWHPHRGFETVTYLLEGDAEHRDSMGNHGFLRAGDTQWMTAGSGVLHKEGPSAESQRHGGRTHGLQLWVNLPAAEKMTAPAYQDLRAASVPRHELPGATVRVIAGDLFELHGPGSTHTPISYAHVTLSAGTTVSTALPAGHVVLVYPLTGSISIAGQSVAEATLAVVDGGDTLTFTGDADTSEVIVLTGEPLGEPVARMGPFVMNTQAELRQAMVDFDHGKFGSPTD